MKLIYEGSTGNYETKLKATSSDRKTMIFIDAKSAFDSVNWRILRKKNDSDGVRHLNH